MNPNPIDDDSQVKSLTIHNQNVNFMPKFTDLLAQRLEVLSVDGCHLKEVSKADLQQFPRLTHFSMANNVLEWLDDDLFEFNPQLEIISFRGNKKLKFIGKNLIKSLTNLRFVDIRSAGCIDFFAGNKVTMQRLNKKLKIVCKNELTELKMLDVEDNTISESTSSDWDETSTFTATTITP